MLQRGTATVSSTANHRAGGLELIVLRGLGIDVRVLGRGVLGSSAAADASNTPCADTRFPLAVTGNTIDAVVHLQSNRRRRSASPLSATAIQQPICSQTAVATPSMRTVFPT